MLIDFLGKIFFRRLQPWQRRREIKNLLLAVTIGLLFSGVAGGLFLLKNHLHK